MNTCHFCKDDLYESKQYRVVAPDNKELYLCDICMADITTFFKSGRVEDVQLNKKDQQQPNRKLVLKKNGNYTYSLCEETSFGLRIFNNIIVEAIHNSYLPVNAPSYANLETYKIRLDLTGKMTDIKLI